MSLRILLLLLCLCAGPLRAQDGAADLRLLPGWRMENGNHMAGLEIRLPAGWKTYWRHPGEAGIPPDFDWTGSTNVAGIHVHWPAPHVFRQAGLRSIGYAGGVILPVEVVPDRPDEAVDLTVRADLGMCRDICVPLSGQSAALLDTGGQADPRIRAALAARPLTAAEAGARAECRISAGAEGATLTARLSMPPLGVAEEVVFEPGDPSLWVSEPRTRREGGALVSTALIEAPAGLPLTLDRSALRTTVIGAQGAVEIHGCD